MPCQALTMTHQLNWKKMQFLPTPTCFGAFFFVFLMDIYDWSEIFNGFPLEVKKNNANDP